MTAPPALPPTVWLLVAPINPDVNPDGISKHGNVRAIFKAGERASRNPSASLARLIEALRPFRPGDFISWLGGDTLVAMLAGVALSTLGVSEWKWLRFIGNDEYQVIHVSLDDLVQSDAEVL